LLDFIDRIRGDKQGSVGRGGATTRRAEAARESDGGTVKGTDSGT